MKSRQLSPIDRALCTLTTTNHPPIPGAHSSASLLAKQPHSALVSRPCSSIPQAGTSSSQQKSTLLQGPAEIPLPQAPALMLQAPGAGSAGRLRQLPFFPLPWLPLLGGELCAVVPSTPPFCPAAGVCVCTHEHPAPHWTASSLRADTLSQRPLPTHPLRVSPLPQTALKLMFDKHRDPQRAP